jgi:hypothetical protein
MRRGLLQTLQNLLLQFGQRRGRLCFSQGELSGGANR